MDITAESSYAWGGFAYTCLVYDQHMMFIINFSLLMTVPWYMRTCL